MGLLMSVAEMPTVKTIEQPANGKIVSEKPKSKITTKEELVQ